MNSLLVISNVLLWVLVVGLFFLVFVLTRQIGVLYERIAPAGALMLEQRLKIGDKAPRLEVKDLNSSNDITIGERNHADKSQLLFFLSPDCPVCKTLLPIVRSVRGTEKKWLDIVLATDYDQDKTSQFIAEQNLGDFTFVNSELLGKSYGVGKLPYAILVDESGVVKSMGLVNSREHFESLFIAKETNTASVQEYLQRTQSVH